MCFFIIVFFCQHLYQRHFPTEKHLREQNTLTPRDLNQQFSILKKCRCKLECFIRDTVRFIRTLRSTLNTQIKLTPSVQNVSLICIFMIETLCQHVAANSTNFLFSLIFVLKMFLERFFHHKLNFNFAFLEIFFEKKKTTKKKKWSFLKLISQLSTRS